MMWKYLVMKEAGLLTLKSRPALVQRARRSTRLCKALFCNRLAYHMEVSPFYPLEKTTYSLRFNTKTLYLKERKAFYSGKRGEKRVPANLDQILSPQSLAVWFMDDGGGGGKNREGMVLDVTGFCQEGRNLIRRVLHDQFLIGSTIQQSSLNSRRKSAKIFIPKKWARPFKEIISPFLVPTMRYKIGDWVRKKRWAKRRSFLVPASNVKNEIFGKKGSCTP